MKPDWMKMLRYVPLASIACGVASAAGSDEAASGNKQAANALQEKYAALENRLHHSQFKQPVVLDSSEAGSRVTGEIFAVINHPFTAVSEQLNKPEHWCDVFSLHINTKYCRAVVKQDLNILKVSFGKKTPQALPDAARVEFTYSSEAATASYLDIKLSATKGALGTSDFRIEFEAVPLQDGNTFLHFTYSYSVNLATRFATSTYLATIGRNKPGFTIIGTDRSGQPQYISGVRGIMERNTMRYYLAIDSYFATHSESPSVQLEQRLQSWFTAVEMYPLQLHELDRAEYFPMKRAEYLRQQTAD
jgi:hypothetical protein